MKMVEPVGMPLPSHAHVLPRRDFGAPQTSNHDVWATHAKDNCRDPSPARKHGGLRMTHDSKFGIRIELSACDYGRWRLFGWILPGKLSIR
jgi:hypothetical protein